MACYKELLQSIVYEKTVVLYQAYKKTLTKNKDVRASREKNVNIKKL